MRDDPDQTDNGQASGIHHGANPGSLHSRAGAAKKFKPGITQAKRFHKSGGIGVPGGLASRNQDFVGHCY